MLAPIPLALDIGPSELLIILAIVILLFGGSRLAGLGKSAGRALREFKEETDTPSPDEIADDADRTASAPPDMGADTARPTVPPVQPVEKAAG